MVSDVEEARRAVREQIGNGADLIKVYADWETPTLTIEELTVIVQEAHKLGHKVAAHATTPQGIKNAVNAGVDSIEHGHRADHEAIDMMKARGVFLVPTIAVVDADIAKLGTLSPDRQQHVNKFLAGIQDEIQYAMSQNVKIAMGFDASEKGRHGKNADELIAMAKRGMPNIEVIRSATINGAELMSWQDNVGAVEPGKYADLIAVDGDPLKDISLMKNIRFVMKDGEVVKDISHP
jgi:imidazolonepropionase-like amidohydrolase